MYLFFQTCVRLYKASLVLNRVFLVRLLCYHNVLIIIVSINMRPNNYMSSFATDMLVNNIKPANMMNTHFF